MRGSSTLPHYMDPEPGAVWPRYVALYIALFLFLGLTSTFDYRRLLLPDHESAVVQCQLTNLTLDSAITEHVIGHTKRDALTLYLYTTILTRILQCRHLARDQPNQLEGPEMTFIYHHHYLNISHIDVNEEMTLVKKRHENPLLMWHYDVEKYEYLLLGHEVDQHGLSEIPLDIYKDSLTSWLGMKLIQAGASALLVGFAILAHPVYNKHRIAIHYWIGKIFPPSNTSVIHSISSRQCV